MGKRISAFLCDLVALCIVVAGFILMFSAIFGYDGHVARLEEISEEYEMMHGVDFDISDEDYKKLTEAEQAKYKLAKDAFSVDAEANRVYNLLINLTFAMVSIGILLAFLLLNILVPLLFGNGQTLGKKIFGIAVIREDGVKIDSLLLFAREILGKCTVETMLPVLIVLMIYWSAMDLIGSLALIVLLIVEVSLLTVTSKRQLLHDKIAHTVTVDYASQRIFDSVEDMIAYKQRVHSELVESETN
jgi:uncharacterized RDD family membrane protein YckC